MYVHIFMFTPETEKEQASALSVSLHSFPSISHVLPDAKSAAVVVEEKEMSTPSVSLHASPSVSQSCIDGCKIFASERRRGRYLCFYVFEDISVEVLLRRLLLQRSTLVINS